MTRFVRRRICALTILALVAAMTTTLTTALTAPAQAACSSMTVKGVVKSGGKVRPRWGVAILLHNHAKPLAGGRANRHGGYRIHVCRSAAVRAYANRHSGHVNLDILAHSWNRRSRLLVRTVTPRLRAASVRVPGRFVAMGRRSATVDTFSSGGVRTARGGVIRTGDAAASSALAHPPAMYLEAVPGVTTTYTLDSSYMGSVATAVGTEDGGYGISGSITVKSEHGFAIDGVVHLPRRSKRYAVMIRPEIRATMTYVCMQRRVIPESGGMWTPQTCTHGMDAAWTGAATRTKARYTPCTWGRAEVIFLSNHEYPRLRVGKNATFTAAGGFKTPYVTADFSTAYGGGTHYQYTLNQTKKTRRFCVSGDAKTVPESGRIYITPWVPSGPACPAATVRPTKC